MPNMRKVGTIYNEFYEHYRNSDHYAQDMDEAVEEFKADRLKSFYLENPLVGEPSLRLLKEAKELFDSKHYSAAQVFAGAATEVIFQEVLLKPIVYGFVHSDNIASMLAHIIDETKGVYKFKALLVHIISEFAGVDLYSYRIGSATQGLWQDLADVRKHRNDALHKAIQATEGAASQAIAVGSALSEKIFPAVTGKLGLHLHEGIRVCGNLRRNANP